MNFITPRIKLFALFRRLRERPMRLNMALLNELAPVLSSDSERVSGVVSSSSSKFSLVSLFSSSPEASWAGPSSPSDIAVRSATSLRYGPIRCDTSPPSDTVAIRTSQYAVISLRSDTGKGRSATAIWRYVALRSDQYDPLHISILERDETAVLLEWPKNMHP
jgi:hypothetical protein